MSEIKFSCTQCGRCCHNLGLPLTVDEAIVWLEDGGRVNIYCEADPWPSEPPADNLLAAHRRRRSFPAPSGSSHARITSILVAPVSGPCRNLGENMLCRIYERRPLVCRVYPAEISPFIQLDTAKKGCPPEAWQSGETIVSNGITIHPYLLEQAERSRQTDQDDAPFKSLVCGELNINVTGLAGEGFSAYEPSPVALLNALRLARKADALDLPLDQPWRFCSPLPQTTAKLSSQGFEMAEVTSTTEGYSFLFSQTRVPTGTAAVAS
jgi:Fe-S-cluster containining protein